MIVAEQEPDSINKQNRLVFRFAQIVKPLDGSDRTPRQKELFRLFLEVFDVMYIILAGKVTLWMHAISKLLTKNLSLF